ncbi:hypothetical protein [Burkholderia pseudomultivorans]|uniref:Uncharacterized protein n=1 Tax=Burkholderia pseudomultivorans TaxID=1207504 RepID=A0A132E753_9BURK|nr:hypothetical protein [Burkholderia pseudomultivorans]KWF18295.1 hypothetical protein WT56_30665 [Burkholderia pseudomultivorans]MDR8728570.1 hypothetical protein [Burkholderia pseudomultivorans]MDR8737276.1 hypothetical protein [Burkholderia pseudomultivorans]MDR8743269.1 hypothetical protein [Burkholderia pseudomultivorans]MDR8754754.1 hypothetical protein [Burkholderia pseudomultivorans]
MPHYCPSRAAFAVPRSSGAAAPRPASRIRGIRSAVAEWCLRAVGWHRLERLLASIPDSNDDFGIG